MPLLLPLRESGRWTDIGPSNAKYKVRPLIVQHAFSLLPVTGLAGESAWPLIKLTSIQNPKLPYKGGGAAVGGPRGKIKASHLDLLVRTSSVLSLEHSVHWHVQWMISEPSTLAPNICSLMFFPKDHSARVYVCRYNILYCIILYYIILNYSKVYYIILSYTKLYCVILYYITLYNIILYYSLLYYNITI